MASGLAAIARQHPELWASYVAYVDTVWSSEDLPPGTLELCRVRIAHLLGAEVEASLRIGAVGPDHAVKVDRLADWPTDPMFTGGDRAALAFAEQYLIDAQALDAERCFAVVDVVGDAGLVTLAVGVGLAEGLTRMAAVLGDVPTARVLDRLASRVGRTGVHDVDRRDAVT